jgi:hypothetical protein
MKRRKITLLAVLAIVGFLFYYLYGGSATPSGQQPLVRLTDSNISSLRDAFNGSGDSVRLLVLVSPT